MEKLPPFARTLNDKFARPSSSSLSLSMHLSFVKSKPPTDHHEPHVDPYSRSTPIHHCYCRRTITVSGFNNLFMRRN
ncbi:hypothetical protein HanPI659440_Chr01g0010501 [Helianthus annuus]|nr:hypothetical protein HanPI659440_Chr01g0010501 [Helianthus annuus]